VPIFSISENLPSSSLSNLKQTLQCVYISSFFWQGILLGLFVLPLLYKCSLQVWAYCQTLGKQRTQAVEKQAEKRIGSGVFYVSLLVALLMLVPSWTRLVGLEVHPFGW
jgi:dolichol kinase/splicing factor 3B subunit 1